MDGTVSSSLNGNAVDLEKNVLGKEDVEAEDGGADATHSSSDGSAFSESRHVEGIRSRSPSRSRSRTISRAPSQRLERATTTASNALSTIRSRVPRRPFSHRLEHEKTTVDVIVDFEDQDDPYRPINWPFKKKVITTVLYGLTTLAATLSSSIFSASTVPISKEFHVATEVSTLGTSLFLIGFGAGPLLFAPLSEVYGRKPAVLIPTFIGAMFAFGAGAGKDIQTIIICRFFQGLFMSAPVTNTGGVLGDIWSAKQRGAAIVGYALCLVGGPTIGPIIGGAFTITPGLGWRWTQYLSGMYTLAILVADIVVLDESYPAALLVAKARRLRHSTGNWALHAKHEEWDVSLSEMANKYLVRPFQLLRTPICFLIALYAGFCYGILYGMLGAFPYVFQDLRGYNQVIGALPFLALLLGTFIGGAMNLVNQRFYVKALEKNNYRPVPEARLPPMCIGSFFFAGGLFVFAWTANPGITWVAPCIGGVMAGVGFFTIFQAALNYLLDTFQRYGASAVAANTFVRSAFAGAFPLFITYQLRAMGVGWGVTVYAIFATCLIPIPFCFIKWGPRIRARGEWSRESTL